MDKAFQGYTANSKEGLPQNIETVLLFSGQLKILKVLFPEIPVYFRNPRTFPAGWIRLTDKQSIFRL